MLHSPTKSDPKAPWGWNQNNKWTSLMFNRPLQIWLLAAIREIKRAIVNCLRHKIPCCTSDKEAVNSDWLVNTNILLGYNLAGCSQLWSLNLKEAQFRQFSYIFCKIHLFLFPLITVITPTKVKAITTNAGRTKWAKSRTSIVSVWWRHLKGFCKFLRFGALL